MLPNWGDSLGVLVFQSNLKKKKKKVILIHVSGMELNKIDSNCCVCHSNDYQLDLKQILDKYWTNTVFQKWVGWVNSFSAVIPSLGALSLPLCAEFISKGLSPCFTLRRKFTFFLSGCWSVWAVAPTPCQAPAPHSILTDVQNWVDICPKGREALSSAAFQGIISSKLPFFPSLGIITTKTIS